MSASLLHLLRIVVMVQFRGEHCAHPHDLTAAPFQPRPPSAPPRFAARHPPRRHRGRREAAKATRRHSPLLAAKMVERDIGPTYLRTTRRRTAVKAAEELHFGEGVDETTVIDTVADELGEEAVRSDTEEKRESFFFFSVAASSSCCFFLILVSLQALLCRGQSLPWYSFEQ
jgi:hypothetical protein